MSEPVTITREQKLYDALKRITFYARPEEIRKRAGRGKCFGLSAEEAIEAAYENVLAEASGAIRGMHRPRLSISRKEAKP